MLLVGFEVCKVSEVPRPTFGGHCPPGISSLFPFLILARFSDLGMLPLCFDVKNLATHSGLAPPGFDYTLPKLALLHFRFHEFPSAFIGFREHVWERQLRFLQLGDDWLIEPQQVRWSLPQGDPMNPLALSLCLKHAESRSMPSISVIYVACGCGVQNGWCAIPWDGRPKVLAAAVCSTLTPLMTKLG